MKMRKKLWVTGIVAMMVAVAGCSGGGKNEGASNNGDVSVQLYQKPRGFNPLIAPIGPDQLMMQLHWDALVSLDDKNGYGPRLATSWEMSSDAKTWTFHLVKGVKWSDGEPFTANDVVFTYNLYANPRSGSANVGLFNNVVGATEFAAGKAPNVEGIKAPDDETVVIELKNPNVAFLENLIRPVLQILPEHALKDVEPASLTDNEFFRNPTTGLGPYVFSKWINDDEVEFEANPEYRADLKLDHVYAKYVTTDVASAQLETGEIDFAQVSAADVDRVKNIDGIQFHHTEGPGIMALHTAIDSGKLADKRVRQAILYAIDREAIVKQAINGQGKVVDTVLHGPEWAIPSDLKHYDYDPAKAKALLAEAGWDPKTKVHLEIVPGQRDRDTTVTIVADQLKKVGIDAEVKQFEAAQLSEAVGGRDFDLLVSGYGIFVVDPSSINSILMCDQVGGANISAYCNPDLDKLLNKGFATSDQAERAAIYQDAMRVMAEEVPIIPLYVPDTLAATTDRLEGFKLNSSVTDAFWNAADWSVG